MMDLIYDIVSVNTFWTILFIVHALLAVALIGALTHQATAVLMPVRQVIGSAGFVTRFRAVRGAGYATAVCVLWIVTFVFGAWIYTKYRIYIRMAVLSRDYLTVPVGEIGAIRSLLTMVGGRVVYAAESYAGLEEPPR
jgi:hypothetical protein